MSDGPGAQPVNLSGHDPEPAPEWRAAGNNVCGVLHGRPSTSSVAACFASAGWRSRMSSWFGYEVETSWCRIDLDPIEGPATLLDGVVDPDMLDALASLLAVSGLRFVLELYDDEGSPLREIRSE